ncbi:hypothetical protein H1V43_32115 [Streptomyces sp. PSKA54]|uniref:Uncharacterized protein n=1 Tax=Streptomyces himalayensis subsp. aureolus TaxID=2758039 RepID=A0A7W2D6Y7_9ACTN|nr:hypothetical protein [Streptomyces himalayensis]MBA4865910.1 hypothetical protein [Streptomyces himalayensis subsp. aureolus]
MNRVEPRMPAAAYKTFQILAPVPTHWRPASCAEVDCPDYVNGWRVRIEGLDAQMLHAAKTSGRKYSELRVAEGETWLVYEAGQPCFRAAQHRKRIDRPELFLVRDGDHRGNPRGTKARMHAKPEHWVENFAEHQQGLADAHQKG